VFIAVDRRLCLCLLFCMDRRLCLLFCMDRRLCVLYGSEASQPGRERKKTGAVKKNNLKLSVHEYGADGFKV